MAWEEVKSETASEMWDKVGTLEGTFVGVKENVGANDSKVYTVTVKDGDVSFWGSTVLDTKLEGMVKGTPIRVTALGKVKSEKTGREYNDFKVEFQTGFQEVPAVKPQVRAATAFDDNKDEEPINLDDIPF